MSENFATSQGRKIYQIDINPLTADDQYICRLIGSACRRYSAFHRQHHEKSPGSFSKSKIFATKWHIKFWIYKLNQLSVIVLQPSRQNCRKSSVEECIFGYMALHIECRFNKNSLLRCYFLAILPAGKVRFTFRENRVLKKGLVVKGLTVDINAENLVRKLHVTFHILSHVERYWYFVENIG